LYSVHLLHSLYTIIIIKIDKINNLFIFISIFLKTKMNNRNI